MSKKVNEEVLDLLAELEVQALLDGLQDPEMRKNPSFLEKVRKFLAQNKLLTTPQTPGVQGVQRAAEEIPDFDKMQ